MPSRQSDIPPAAQRSLFADVPKESVLGRRHAEVIREALRTAIRRCRDGNRNYIAYEMSELLGLVVSVPQIDGWTRDSDEDGRHIPAELLAGFMLITKSTLPLQALAELVGCRLIDEEQNKLLVWAEAERDAACARASADRKRPPLIDHVLAREGRR